MKYPTTGKYNLVQNGGIGTNTGLAKSIADGKWYFVRNGVYDSSFTGVAKSCVNGNWYGVQNGKLDWNYTGGTKSVSNGRWYAISKGILNCKYNGLLTCMDKVERGFLKGEAIKIKSA